MRQAIEIEESEIDDLIESLLVGLAAYGEIERLKDAKLGAELCRREIPPGMSPIDPCGHASVVSDFAEALRIADRLRRDLAHANDEAAMPKERRVA